MNASEDLDRTTSLTDDAAPLDGRSSKPRIALFGFIFAIITIVVLFIVFNRPIMEFMAIVAKWIQGSGWWGRLVLTLVIFCLGTPLPGYGVMLVFAGFIYGYSAFICTYIGGFLGAISCFALSRYCLRHQAETLVWAAYPKLRLLDNALQQSGLGLLLLIRIAPYPYGWFNVLLAITGISFQSFMVATALSLPKQLLHITLGASAQSMSHVFEGEDSVVKLILLGFAILASLIIMCWIKSVVNRITNQGADVEDTFSVGLQPMATYGAEISPTSSATQSPQPTPRIQLADLMAGATPRKSDDAPAVLRQRTRSKTPD